MILINVLYFFLTNSIEYSKWIMLVALISYQFSAPSMMIWNLMSFKLLLFSILHLDSNGTKTISPFNVKKSTNTVNPFYSHTPSGPKKSGVTKKNYSLLIHKIWYKGEFYMMCLYRG